MFVRIERINSSKYDLFPLNFLDTIYLEDKEDKRNSLNEFISLISDKNTLESNVTDYINSWHFYLIGGLVKHYYYFGHHSAYLFPEFKLGTSYEVDYLVIGKNSDGFHFLFIELEAVNRKKNKSIVTIDGREGDAIRAGLNQVNDWVTWLQGNYYSFIEALKKFKNEERELPEEFYVYDSTRFHFAVIAGRRSDYSKKIRRVQRDYNSKNIKLLHYDNVAGRCQLCGTDLTGLLNTDKEIHHDHIVPLELGGTNDPTNFQLTCSVCNHKKGYRNADTRDIASLFWDIE